LDKQKIYYDGRQNSVWMDLAKQWFCEN